MTIEKRSLWEWRASRRLSRRALARLAKVSESTIESIENGRHPPNMKTMQAIIGVFGISLDQVDWDADAKTLAPVA